MSALSEHTAIGLGPALSIGVTLAGALLWLGWRKPTSVLILGLAALALRPQLLWGGPPLGVGWGLHHSLLAFALAMNALRYGVRRAVNWPILALLAVLALSLTLGDLHPKLTPLYMLMSLAIIALPFTFTQVLLAPGSRRICGIVIAALPLLSVVLGAVLQLAGLREVFSYTRWVDNWYRLEGATGNAAVFAALAFTGFAVALHEWTRPARPYSACLAALDLVLVILSGTRMAIFACALFAAAYVLASEGLRQQLRRHRMQLLLSACLVAAIVLAYWPTLEWRIFGGTGFIQLSQREDLWIYHYGVFLDSPWFGRGFGAGFFPDPDWPNGFPAPHNEYLHLLVIGGLVGFTLCIVAIVSWYRQLLSIASPNDRGFLLAMAPALAVYALTDNMLVYSSVLALYAYLGLVLTPPLLQQALPEPPQGRLEPVAGRLPHA